MDAKKCFLKSFFSHSVCIFKRKHEVNTEGVGKYPKRLKSQDPAGPPRQRIAGSKVPIEDILQHPRVLHIPGVKRYLLAVPVKKRIEGPQQCRTLKSQAKSNAQNRYILGGAPRKARSARTISEPQGHCKPFPPTSAF